MKFVEDLMHVEEFDNMPKSGKQVESAEQPGSEWHRRFSDALGILNTAIDEGRTLYACEIASLEVVMNWNAHHSERQRKRLLKRRHLRGIAGSDDDRQKARQAVADCQRILDVRGSELQQEIDRLNAERAKLEADLLRAQRRRDEMVAALEQSRTILPDDFAKLHERERGEIKNRLGRRVNELEVEILHLRKFAEFNLRDAKAIALLGTRFVSTDPESRKNVLKPAFHAYRQECIERLPELEAELAQAQAELNAALAEHDAKIDLLNW